MNLFDLFAKISLDSSGYEKGLKDAETKGKVSLSKIGSALGNVAKVSVAAFGAAAAGVTAIVSKSVAEYSEYEQLVGGVNKLFGDSADAVMKYAEDAYKTSGLSASKYMEQATSFSAALINSLNGDTARAAELTDVAMRAISDNFNTFGGDISSVQNAFQGFAKQNYTMLDNLKLGYGGTKSEMERLIEDANEYAASIGQASDLSIDSFADIVQAIELVQQKQHIAGTTQKEAASTIQGALGMTKAAWQNLITGLSDSEADINSLVGNLISSAGAVAKNILPTIKQALSGIGKAVAELAPAIGAGISGLITDVLPDLVSSAITLIGSLSTSLRENAGLLTDAAFEIIDVLVESLTDPEGLLSLVDAASEILIKLVEGLTEALPTLLPAVVEIIMTIVDKLTEPDMLDSLIEAAIQLIEALVEGLFGAQDKIIAMAPKIVFNLLEAIIKAAPRIALGAVELILQFVSGIVGSFGQIIAVGADIIQQVKDGIHQKLGDAKNWGRDLIQSFVGGITEKWNALKSKVTGIADFFKGLFGHSHPEFGPMADDYKWMPDMMNLFTQGIEKNTDKLQKAAAEAFDLSDAVTMPEMSYTSPVSAKANYTTQRAKTDSDTKFDEIMGILQQYLPQLANMKMVMDTGTLVGELTPGIDAELGMRQRYAMRGATV